MIFMIFVSYQYCNVPLIKQTVWTSIVNPIINMPLNLFWSSLTQTDTSGMHYNWSKLDSLVDILHNFVFSCTLNLSARFIECDLHVSLKTINQSMCVHWKFKWQEVQLQSITQILCNLFACIFPLYMWFLKR